MDEWRWTSHGATIGTSPAGAVAVPDVLSYLGADAASARARYLELVSDASEVPVASHPLVEGDNDFVEAHLERLLFSPEHPRASVRPRRPDLADLVSSHDDGAAILRAFTEHGYSMRQIATHLGCGVTTIHRRVREHETTPSA